MSKSTKEMILGGGDTQQQGRDIISAVQAPEPYQMPIDNLENYLKFQEEKKKDDKTFEKRERRKQLFSAIGDGVSAIANMFATGNYAPNAYNPANSLYGKSLERYEKLKAERDRDAVQRYMGMTQARAADRAAEAANAAGKRKAWEFGEQKRREDEKFDYAKERDLWEREHRLEREKKADEQWGMTFNETRNQNAFNRQNAIITRSSANQEQIRTLNLPIGEDNAIVSIDIPRRQWNLTNVSSLYTALGGKNILDRPAVAGAGDSNVGGSDAVYRTPTMDEMEIYIGQHLDSALKGNNRNNIISILNTMSSNPKSETHMKKGKRENPMN